MEKRSNKYRKFWMVLGVFGLVGAFFISQTQVKAVSLPRKCSVQFEIDGYEDTANADIVIDLYKVADAIEDPVYDTYSYETIGAFQTLEDKLADLSAITNQEYQAITQEAAKLVQEQKAGTPAATTSLDARAPIESGLYLALPHSQNMEDYFRTIKTPQGETLVTYANSVLHTYNFQPMLVSLPGKDAMNGEISSANPSVWNDDLTITLKVEESPRMGSLEIVKSLNQFDGNGNATFVFSIAAYKDETRQELVYSNVESIVFDGAGTNSVQLLNCIPVGSYVVIEEVYSGASYEIVGASTQDTTIVSAEEIASVSFENTSNNTDHHGSSVTNRFTYNDMGMNKPEQDFGGQ